MTKTDNKVLLVEGPSDREVVYQLLNHYDLGDLTKQGHVKVTPKTGSENVLAELETYLYRPQLTHIGIILDADEDVARRWQAIRQRLSTPFRPLDMPTQPDPNGSIFRVERPNLSIVTVGVWIMPDNQLPGRLENFIQFLIPAADKLWVDVQTCISQINPQHLPFDLTTKTPIGRESWTQKAHIHTWLAWQEDPGCPMGLAINKRFLDADVDQADQFINWFKRLFMLTSSSDTF